MTYPRRRNPGFDPIPHQLEQLPILPDLPFREAAQRWLRSRRVEEMPDPTLDGIAMPARRMRRYHPVYIRPRTLQSYTDYVRALTLFFADRPLQSITPNDLRRYQAERSRGEAPFLRRRKPDADPQPSPVSAKKVNQELEALIIMLRRAGLWKRPLCDEYEPLLPPMTEIARALTQEEEARWLAASRFAEHLFVVNWYSTLALHTCMSTNELRMLKVGDIHPEASVLTISSEGSKNVHRHRTVPLGSSDALWAVKNLLLRAAAIGSVEPHHYIFPFRKAGRYIPVMPMGDSGIKKPWQEVRDKTALPWFRQYDLRHTAITRYAEAGTPLSVIMSMAGHISDRMRQHYTHISEATQLRWMEHTRAMHGVRAPVKPAPAPSRNQSGWGLNWTGIQ
jgi:integrase